jgi:hypothetical protein
VKKYATYTHMETAWWKVRRGTECNGGRELVQSILHTSLELYLSMYANWKIKLNLKNSWSSSKWTPNLFSGTHTVVTRAAKHHVWSPTKPCFECVQPCSAGLMLTTPGDYGHWQMPPDTCVSRWANSGERMGHYGQGSWGYRMAPQNWSHHGILFRIPSPNQKTGMKEKWWWLCNPPGNHECTNAINHIYVQFPMTISQVNTANWAIN